MTESKLDISIWERELADYPDEWTYKFRNYRLYKIIEARISATRMSTNNLKCGCYFTFILSVFKFGLWGVVSGVRRVCLFLKLKVSI